MVALYVHTFVSNLFSLILRNETYEIPTRSAQSTKTPDMSMSRSNPAISAETDFGAAGMARSAPPGRKVVTTALAQRKKRSGGANNGIEGSKVAIRGLDFQREIHSDANSLTYSVVRLTDNLNSLTEFSRN